DWKETLSYWDTQIARARVSHSKGQLSAPLAMMILRIEGPVWLKPDSPADKLFHPLPNDGPLITFLGSSATIANPANEIEPQMPDAPGRLSRALPLLLAEQVNLNSDAKVQTLIPWISSGGGGFVLSGVAWSNDDAFDYVKQSGT